MRREMNEISREMHEDGACFGERQSRLRLHQDTFRVLTGLHKFRLEREL